MVDAVVALVLGGLYTLAAHQVWFKSKPKWWLIAMPASMAIVVAVIVTMMGAFAVIPLLLNLVVLVLIPLRIRSQRSLEAIG